LLLSTPLMLPTLPLLLSTASPVLLLLLSASFKLPLLRSTPPGSASSPPDFLLLSLLNRPAFLGMAGAGGAGVGAASAAGSSFNPANPTARFTSCAAADILTAELNPSGWYVS